LLACPACPARKNDCIGVHPVGFMDLSYGMKFEVQKYFIRVGAISTGERLSELESENLISRLWEGLWERIIMEYCAKGIFHASPDGTFRRIMFPIQMNLPNLPDACTL